MMKLLAKKYNIKGDDSKEYSHINEEKTSKICAKKQGEHILKPCRCYHLIAVDTDGNFSKVLYFRNVDFSELSHGSGKSFDTVSEGIFLISAYAQDTIFELTEPGTYVRLRSPLNSIEQFFIAEVINKAIASEDITDPYGHCIVAGESFLEVMYLQ